MAQAIKCNDKIELMEAIDREMVTLEKTGCSEKVNQPGNERVLHTKYVLKQKGNENGNICRYEARLVAYENEEVDSKEETLSPVATHSVSK